MSPELKERIIAIRYQPTTVGNMMVDPAGGYCSYEAVEILRSENKRLRDALTDAEKSLWTISVQAGLNDYLSDYSDIRCYARNRSICATEALKGTP